MEGTGNVSPSACPFLPVSLSPSSPRRQHRRMGTLINRLQARMLCFGFMSWRATSSRKAHCKTLLRVAMSRVVQRRHTVLIRQAFGASTQKLDPCLIIKFNGCCDSSGTLLTFLDLLKRDGASIAWHVRDCGARWTRQKGLCRRGEYSHWWSCGRPQSTACACAAP